MAASSQPVQDLKLVPDGAVVLVVSVVPSGGGLKVATQAAHCVARA